MHKFLPQTWEVVWTTAAVRTRRVRRTLRERFCTWPWRPWQRFRKAEEPMMYCERVNDLTLAGYSRTVIVAHPVFETLVKSEFLARWLMRQC